MKLLASTFFRITTNLMSKRLLFDIENPEERDVMPPLVPIIIVVSD